METRLLSSLGKTPRLMVRIVMDDFGTGYSSPQSLHQLTFTGLNYIDDHIPRLDWAYLSFVDTAGKSVIAHTPRFTDRAPCAAEGSGAVRGS